MFCQTNFIFAEKEDLKLMRTIGFAINDNRLEQIHTAGSVLLISAVHGLMAE